ncbi:putative prefoldin subunit 4 [Wickerhamomyces ciferrii]|uniref:Prefoldin subunit 4 n=1 Tax=Wickerhamomyces ciferrii (strain ATCC 14091 / BCRC 22168 / CBS 111 / JCM 3599 / NBRC 0793 / NRRL Y-1031 F-60-10) TaxID=1206466 RepID=K0KI73_WICCF|nr:putative prefoldin subunit 4 [Wickerhamomyces ciferrii]CCH41862.1 putative prefoldin subunit 4 [Wickerhamomyces ciferrii]
MAISILNKLNEERSQKNQVEVTFEDQKKINEFSKLISKKDSLTLELNKQKQEKEYLADVSLEIELIDEDELINYKISNAFIKLKQSDAVEKLEKDGELLDLEIGKLDEQMDEIDSKLSSLKTELYTKFGDNINLER